jgi:deoxyribonuclease V
MNYRSLHEWPQSRREAEHIVSDLAEQVEIAPVLQEPKTIAAVDTAYGKNAEVVFTSAVLVSFPEIEEIERTFQYGQVSFPYLPGLFYFREGETIIKALSKLKTEPDIIIVHGHGVAHPARCGMASLIGLAFDKPTIGCARKLLAGQHRPVAPGKGNFQPIMIQSREVGYAYRTKDGVKPIFISPGHKCNLEQSRDYIVRNLRGFRQPEPLRLAHLYANKFRRHIERKGTAANPSESETI